MQQRLVDHLFVVSIEENFHLRFQGFNFLLLFLQSLGLLLIDLAQLGSIAVLLVPVLHSVIQVWVGLWLRGVHQFTVEVMNLEMAFALVIALTGRRVGALSQVGPYALVVEPPVVEI